MTLVLVAGALANKPRHGAEAWVRIQWAVGLRRLGFDVHLAEQLAAVNCVDEAGNICDFEKSTGARFFRDVAKQFNLDATLVCDDGRTIGRSYAELLELAESSMLLVNISGHLCDTELLRRMPCKAYVDLDPGYTQFWHAQGNDGARLAGNDLFFTVGENIGHPQCPIPTCGLKWRPTRQPVVLDFWVVDPIEYAGRFTTVASWRGPYGPIAIDGKLLGGKVHEFRRFREVARLCGAPLEIALNIDPADDADRRSLLHAGWRLTDSGSAAGTPQAFRNYVAGSNGEFSVAQGMYVGTECGWFSDRSAYYLAAGRPVVVQDTGFSLVIHAGEGLVAFRTLEEAVAGIDRVAQDYANQCRVARELAQEFFDARKVLGRFIDQTGVAP
jgi:hypothetical protein